MSEKACAEIGIFPYMGEGAGVCNQSAHSHIKEWSLVPEWGDSRREREEPRPWFETFTTTGAKSLTLIRHYCEPAKAMSPPAVGNRTVSRRPPHNPPRVMFPCGRGLRTTCTLRCPRLPISPPSLTAPAPQDFCRITANSGLFCRGQHLRRGIVSENGKARGQSHRRRV